MGRLLSFCGLLLEYFEFQTRVEQNGEVKTKLLCLRMGAVFNSAVQSRADDLGFSVVSAETEKEVSALVSEGPWDVVVAQFSDMNDSLELLSDVLSGDLFTQVIFVGNDVAVRDAVLLMRAGSWSVIDMGEDNVDDVIESISVAAEERREDMDIVSGSDS